MTGWLLSFVPTWVWIVAGAAAVFAVRAYLGEKVAIAAAVVLALFAAYQTGVRGERKRGEAASLRQTIAVMQRNAEVSLDIQTRMAQRLAALRIEEQEQDVRVDALIADIERRPAGACILDDARRLRLQSIRIGRPSVDKRR